MHIILTTAFFLLGTIIASGTNALVYRYQRALPWGGSARSQCPHCGHTLSALELVPLVSFVVLVGRCRECGQKISLRYPLVELVGGGLFLLSFLTLGFSVALLFALPAMTLLLFMYIYDADTLLLPNPAVWSFNLLAFLSLFVVASVPILSLDASVFTTPSWWALVAGPLISLPFFVLWLGSGGRAMGFGDVKLALGIGWFLGLAGGLSAVMYSFWIGAVVSLGLLGIQWLKGGSSSNGENQDTIDSQEAWGEAGNPQPPTDSRRLTLKSAVPFGPFLLLGFLLVYFGDIILFNGLF